MDHDVVQHCRIDPEVAQLEQSLLESMIAAARGRCELATGRQLLEATYTLDMDSWTEEGLYQDGAIYLPKPPLSSVTSVKYIDPDGDQQTWSQDASGYVVDAPSGPEAQKGRIFPSYGIEWPTVRTQRNAIEVVFVAGYPSVESIPVELLRGMLLLVGEMYEHREESVVGVSVSPAVLGAQRLFEGLRAY